MPATILEIPLRPVLALVRVVRNREAYMPQVGRDTPVLKVDQNNVLGREESGDELAAKKMADHILACCGIGSEEARSTVEKAGKAWDQPGCEFLSTDCLRAQIS